MKEISRQWLNFATEDLDTIKEIIGIEHLTNIAVFHCRQCIEKSFKAVLEENKLDVPKVHDLAKLYGKVKEIIDCRFDEDILDIFIGSHLVETLLDEGCNVKRPGTGISPSEWDKIIGRKAMRDFKEDEMIEI